MAVSSSPEEAPGRATSTTTRMSGSTSLMTSLNLASLISDFARAPVSLYS